MSEKAPPPRLGDRQRLSWLRLIRTPNVGPSSFRDLINRFGSAETALEMLPELMLAGGLGRSVRIPSLAEAEAELEQVVRAGARLVGIGEPDYPPVLRHMENAPPMLAVKGEAAVFSPAAGRHRGCPQRIACRGQDGAVAGGFARRRRLCRGLGPGPRHRHRRAPGRSRDRHDRRLRGRAHHPYPPDNAGLADEIAARGGAARLGNAHRLGAARAGFSAPQPHHRRPVAGARRRRGGTAVGLADQRQAGDRDGAAGVCGSGLAARPARRRLQRASEGRAPRWSPNRTTSSMR